MTYDQEAPTDINTPLIDLELQHFSHARGDLTVIGTWFLTNGRPCLVIVPRHGKLDFQRVMPCIVPMDQAWLWDETTGDGAHCAELSIAFARALKLNVYDVHTLVRLTSLVREHIGDMLKMPPLPASQKQVLADVLMTNTDTGKSVESAVVDYV